MATANVDNLVSDLFNHAAAGVEGSIPAAQAAALLDRVPPPVYPEEASSAKERRFEDRQLLRALVTRALEGRTSDGLTADAVLMLNRILAADEAGEVDDLPHRARIAARACLQMAGLLISDAPEVVMRHQKWVLLRAVEVL